jgi:hypothetical protein
MTGRGSRRRGSSKQITGNVGLYYVAYRLSQLGWNVMTTSRNASGIDLVCYDASQRFITVQVKAFEKKQAIGLCEGN